MTLNDNAFSFKENLDNDDDQLKLPDDLFHKFNHDRKSSNDSDDMVKYDNDTRLISHLTKIQYYRILNLQIK